MASTAGARHLAESAIYLAAQTKKPVRVERVGTFMETAIQHMDEYRLASFIAWLEDALEA